MGNFLYFSIFFKCAYQIFNNFGNINHQIGSEICPKRTENSQTKGFPESDTTLFRTNFDVTAYLSEKQKCRRRKISKNLFDGAASFRIIACSATIPLWDVRRVSSRDLPRDVRRVSSRDLPREVRRDWGLPNFNSFSFVGSVVRSVVVHLLPSSLRASLRVSLSSSSYPSDLSCVAQ